MAAYYVVSEMLTNAAKHAQASAVYVDVARAEGVLHISVRDDGVGGADPARGSGLVGLRDRVEAPWAEHDGRPEPQRRGHGDRGRAPACLEPCRACLTQLRIERRRPL